jgi:hypothetical protein
MMPLSSTRSDPPQGALQRTSSGSQTHRCGFTGGALTNQGFVGTSPFLLKKGRSAKTQSSAKAADVNRVEQARSNHSGVQTMGSTRAAVSRHFQSRGGNTLPRVSTDEVAKGQAQVLRRKYGPLKSAAKQLANDGGTSERAARNHLAGVNAMNLTDFFNHCRSGSIPELRAWGLMMMGLEAQLDPRFGSELAKGLRAIAARLEGEGA